MKFKINVSPAVNKPLSVWEQKLVSNPIFAFTISVLVFLMFLILLSTFVTSNAGYLPFPGVMAAGQEVVNGIKMFTGDPVETGWGQYHTPALISILLIYFLLPAIFIKTVVNWKTTPRDERNFTHFRKIYIPAILSGIIIAAIVLITVTGITGSLRIRSNINSIQNSNSARDYLTMQLTDINYSARTYFNLPIEAGGGAGSWKNYKLPVNAEENSISFKRFDGILKREEVKNVFLLKPGENDTTIVITGISNFKGNREEFVNADGRKGLIQIHAVITPHTHRINIDQ